jgi:hypothetical protein
MTVVAQKRDDQSPLATRLYSGNVFELGVAAISHCLRGFRGESLDSIHS